jgi:CHAT domain-containing protein
MTATGMVLKKALTVTFLAGAALGQLAAQQYRPQSEPAPADCENALKTAKESKEQARWNRALEACKRVWEYNKGSGSPQTIGEILLNTGRVQAHIMTMKQEALDSYSAAAEAFGKIEVPDRSVQTSLGAAELNVAIELTDLGAAEKALPHYDRALELFRRLSDLRGQAYTLGDRARANFLMGENDTALRHCFAALSIRNTQPAQDRDNQWGKAALLDFIGRIYADLGDQGLAISYFHDALVLARRADYHRFIAFTLNDLGIVWLKQNKPSEAKRNHEKALDELQKNESENTDGVAETQALLADAELALGESEVAIRHYRQALELQERSADVTGQAQTWLSLGKAKLVAGDTAAALDSFAQASQLYHQVHNRVGEASTLFQAAQTKHALKDDAGAKIEISRALEIAEEVRNFTPGQMLRASYFGSLEKMYRFEIDLLLGVQPVSEPDQLRAFEQLQLAQARTLKDALWDRIGNAGTFTTPELRMRRVNTLRDLGKADHTLAGLLSGTYPQDAVDKAFAVLRRQEGLLEQLEEEAKARQPRLGIFSDSLSVQDVQQRLLDPDSALIQFYLAEPASYAWVITEAGIVLVKLPARRVLEHDVRQSVQFGLGGEWAPAQRRAVDRLRRSLVPVFQAAVKKRWIVVPDGALHYFPFAMLTDRQGQAGAPEEVVMVPSASVVDTIRRDANATRPAYALAVFADPVFDGLDSRVARLNAGGQEPVESRSGKPQGPASEAPSLPRLRYSRDEASAISRLFPRRQTRSFLEFSATKQAASGNALSNFRIIHLATHSLADERHPELSKIVFSRVAKNGAPRKGDLFAKDIYNMKLSADLVVLSSCQSAVGKQQPGEGPMSLSRAFLFAGSKAVVASMWEVNDKATAQLMGQFYQHMVKDRLAPASALALAQSEFRRDKRLRNPYYWAGFELYGEWMGP